MSRQHPARLDLTAAQLLAPRRAARVRRRPTWTGYAAVALAAFLGGLVTSSIWWLQ